MRNGFGAPGRGHPSSPRSRSERHVAHGHPSRSSISPIRAMWPSANRIVTPSSRLTSRSTGSLLSSTGPGCLIPAKITRRGRSVHEAGPSSLRSSGGAGGASACGSLRRSWRRSPACGSCAHGPQPHASSQPSHAGSERRAVRLGWCDEREGHSARAISGVPDRHFGARPPPHQTSAFDGARQKNSSWMLSGSRKVSIAFGV